MLIPPPSCVRSAPPTVKPVSGLVITVSAVPLAATLCSSTWGGAGPTAQSEFCPFFLAKDMFAQGGLVVIFI